MKSLIGKIIWTRKTNEKEEGRIDYKRIEKNWMRRRRWKEGGAILCFSKSAPITCVECTGISSRVFATSAGTRGKGEK